MNAGVRLAFTNFRAPARFLTAARAPCYLRTFRQVGCVTATLRVLAPCGRVTGAARPCSFEARKTCIRTP